MKQFSQILFTGLKKNSKERENDSTFRDHSIQLK
jgi:hypothetical protein